ncbi:MAG: cadherin domain-containing protein, partial [Prosthecobacter sp.]
MKTSTAPKPALLGLLTALITLVAAPVSVQAASVTVPPGLAPGTSYRLIYLTSGTRDGQSTNIADYNAFVAAQAAGVPTLAALGTTWTAVASTSAVGAQDNTNTLPASGGVGIYTLNGLNVATNNTDLWDGTINTPITDSTGTVSSGRALSGTDAAGNHFSGPLGANGMDYASDVSSTTFTWISQAAPGISQFTSYRMYAMSGVLVVPPAPSVTLSTADLPMNVSTLAINGTGFDTIPGNNTVIFNNGAVGTVTASSATSLTVTFSTQPISFGSLTAVVTNGNGSSGAPVQVAAVYSPTEALVVVNPGTILQNSAGQLSGDYTLLSGVNQAGLLTGYTSGVTSFNPYIAGNPLHDNIGVASHWLVYVGSGTIDFDLGSVQPLKKVVVWNWNASHGGVGMTNMQVFASSDAAFTSPVLLDSFPVAIPGNNQAQVKTLSATTTTRYVRLVVTSGANRIGFGELAFGAVATPTVTSSTTAITSAATTLTITGSGFDTTPGNNTVVFSNGAVGTVTAATDTSLTVTFTTAPTSLGNLTAIITTSNGSSGAAVQVATVSNIIATLSGGALTITDLANGNDTLSLSESAGNLVIGANAGSFISSNAGTGSGTNSVSIPLASITGLITVNAAGGTDIINVGAFATTFNGLTLNGGTANDTVNLNGDITFAGNANLDVDLSNDDVSPGTDSVVVAASANLIFTGTGTITLKGSGAVSMAAGSSVESVNGAITITSTASGLSLAGATVTTSGTGNVTLAGTGVGDGGGIAVGGGSVVSSTGSGLGVGEGLLTLTGTGSGFGTGIALSGASSVTSVAGAISMTGTGNGGSNGRTSKGIIIDASTVQSTGAATVYLNGKGNSVNFGSDTNAQHHGIQVTGATALITSSGGKITVDGDGRFGRSSNNFGVVVQNGAGVTGTAAAEVELIGITRIVITGAGSRVTTVNGPLKLTGTGSDQANSKGVLITTDGQVASTAGDITITGHYVGGGTATGVGILYDSATAVSTSGTISLVSGSGIAARMMLSNGSISGTAGVTVRAAGGAAIDLGSVTDSASRADLSDTELDMITTSGTLSIGDAGSSEIIISAPITRSASTAMALTSASNIIFNPGSIDTAGGALTLNSGFFGSVQPITSGTDVTTSAATAVAFGVGSQLGIAFAGAVEETDYSPLSVAGQVNLTGVFLVPSGAYVPAVSDSFTLLTNDGTDAITGTFAGLAEGAVIPNFLGSGLGFKISYTGGTGNDVVLSIANTAPTITSNGGGATASIDVAENTTAVTTVVASDAEVPATQTLTYSKSGTNEGLFNIDSSTGALTFITAPNFETGPGPFSVTVTATDNGTPSTLSASQDLTINVTNVNEAPEIGNFGSLPTFPLDFAEGVFNSVTYASSDPDAGQTLTYSKSGADEALFNLTAAGVLTFITPRDFETRTDANTDGVYEVTITITDNGAVPLSDSQALVITVTNRNEVPTFTGGSSPLHTADTGAKTVPGWATAMDDGDSTVTQALTFTVVQNGGAAIFSTAPTIAADGTLSYTLNGSTG